MDRTTKRKRVSERERERANQHYHILNYPQCHLVGGVED